MVIFMSRGVGKDPNFVLIPNPNLSTSQNAIALKQNIGLDKNHDGQITKAEAAGFVQKEYNKGRLPQNYG